MRKLFPAVLALVTGLGCNTERRPQHRELFDAGGMQVISAFANRTDKTLSILYGDSGACLAARSGYLQSGGAGRLTLITYEQADNRFWYGSLINGAIKNVETIRLTGKAGSTGGFVYQLRQGKPPADRSGHTISIPDRVRQILAHKPVVFP